MQEKTLLNDHLNWLETESIYIIREVVAQCANPAMLFSGGKDSIVMFHLARQTFQFGDQPVKLPFQILHIDTGHNYPEVIAYRDSVIEKTGVKLIVGRVEDSIKKRYSSLTQRNGFMQCCSSCCFAGSNCRI